MNGSLMVGEWLDMHLVLYFLNIRKNLCANPGFFLHCAATATGFVVSPPALFANFEPFDPSSNRPYTIPDFFANTSINNDIWKEKTILSKQNVCVTMTCIWNRSRSMIYNRCVTNLYPHVCSSFPFRWGQHTLKAVETMASMIWFRKICGSRSPFVARCLVQLPVMIVLQRSASVKMWKMIQLPSACNCLVQLLAIQLGSGENQGRWSRVRSYGRCN